MGRTGALGDAIERTARLLRRWTNAAEVTLSLDGPAARLEYRLLDPSLTWYGLDATWRCESSLARAVLPVLPGPGLQAAREYPGPAPRNPRTRIPMLFGRFQFPVTTLLGALALGACSHVKRVDPAPAVATFACADSLPRADGTQQSATCVLAREYCYEASGGAAVSHGAHCRPLPKPNATCADLPSVAGSSCTGTPEIGIRATFAFP